ncbi:MAG: FkbM family methyltransferase [Actinomycetota bacterium]|nr:FkbM family methyltransferase [Actinomycetota bacterium]
MRLRDRAVARVAMAPLQLRHWAALARMITTYERPRAAIRRYLSNSGAYPWKPAIRTPTGVIRPGLRDYHDLLTVNEVFCRRDYGHGRDLEVVVDIGANIGLAALFFLTRDRSCRVYCFEPDPANSDVLRETLSGLEDRYSLIERAVTPQPSAHVGFVPQGRYGRFAQAGEDAVEVPAIGMAEAIQEVLTGEPRVDLVKIDTEGSELKLVEALRSHSVMAKVGSVVYEDNDGHTRWLRAGSRVGVRKHRRRGAAR